MTLNKVTKLILTIFFTFSGAAVALAQEIPAAVKNSDFYFLIDADSKEVLLAKNSDTRVPPSSMTKMMTAYVVFKQIKNGKIAINNQCLIGRDAWRKSGSSMFLNYGDIVTIDDLLKGLLAVSGNDAAIALAQASAGGYQNFIKLMNDEASQIGLKNSYFKNPHGLNEAGHYMSLRDLAILTMRIYQEFPQYAHYFSITEFTYGKVTQPNRHPLIRNHYDGVVGGKTGHTNQGGYGVVAMVKRDHRRLIAVVNKAKTPAQRVNALTALLDYGFKNYKKLVLFNKDQELARLPAWLGLKQNVAVAPNQQIALNVVANVSADDVVVKIKFMNPLKAPIYKGTKVADLIIEVKGYRDFQYPLFAKESVGMVGILEKISITSKYKFNNFINKYF